MFSNEHLKLLLQGVAVVLALHFAKGHMTGEYRNLMAVGLVVVVLVVVNHLLSEYEGSFWKLPGNHGLATILGDLGWETTERFNDFQAIYMMECAKSKMHRDNYEKLGGLINKLYGTEKLLKLEKLLEKKVYI